MMMDGYGIVYLRRVGVVIYFGILIDCFILGCGKIYLLGEYEELEVEKGSISFLLD